MQINFLRAILCGVCLLAGATIAQAEWYDSYKNLSSVYGRLDQFEIDHSELVSSFSIGQSYEGREIRGIKISGSGGTKQNRPAVLLNGTLHAREWISPMTNMYAAEQLLGQYGTNSDIRSLLDEVDFYVIPVVNPDGYEYSWASPSNRFWRKNRRVNGNGSFGVDLNRNWGVGWGLNSGSSGNSFSDIYRGTAPFSEPETQALRDFYFGHQNLVANIDFHSFSQLILGPFGYTSVTEPADAALLMSIAEQMSTAIEGVHGETYVPESASDLYLASGISTDWVYENQNVYSYTIELRPDGPLRLSSFALPETQILPTVEEVFAGVLHLGQVTAALAHGDFNYDQQYDSSDLDALTAGILSGTSKAEYDVDGDATVSTADVIAWLENAGEENLGGGAYLLGDANLDGAVNGTDFDIWKANRLAETSDWSRGDFNTDGIVNDADFSIWSASALGVPEPAMACLLLTGCVLLVSRRFKASGG